MRGLGVLLVLLLSAICRPMAAAAQAIPERELAAMVDEMRQALDRPSGQYEVSRSPADGQRLAVNPPVFVWLPVEGASEYVLQYSRDPAFQDSSTVTVKQSALTQTGRASLPWSGTTEFTYSEKPATLHVLHEPLPGGAWYWRYGHDAGDPVGVVFGSVRSFTIADDAIAIPFPDIEQVVARIGTARPRLLVTPEMVERFRDLGRGALSDEVERMKRGGDRFIGEPLLPEPEFLPEGDDWAPTYQRVFRSTRRFFAGMVRCAETYLVSGETKYGDEAKRRLMHTVLWDPNGSTSLGHNDEPATEIVRLAPRVYDSIYDLLTQEEREQCRQCFAVRIPQLYWALKARPFEVNPFESHAMGYYLEDLTEACIAMAGELEVEQWLEYCLMMLWSPFFPPYGGADGGWCEGPSYWGWTVDVFLRAFRLVEQATGIPIHQREWMRNTGYYKLYGNPPYNTMSPFGDGQSGASGGAESMWGLAMAFGDPYLKWFADEKGHGPRGLSAFLFHGQEVIAKPPSDLPQARCFSDVGLVAMHSDLADGTTNVQVLMRSSPYGSISHAYADQNAFTLDAFGEPLAIASGYYPYYGGPHHRQWTWETKAANAIGVDGEGQVTRDWDAKGRIAHFQTDDYCHYALGDATAAYGGRLEKWHRHIIYLRPLDDQMDPVIVIYDDLAAPTPATFQWWLHALEEMDVDSAAQHVRISRNDAQLEVFFLTPSGLGFSQTDQFTVPPEGDYPNQWHLTAQTSEGAQQCRFITVLLPHARNGGQIAAPKLLSGDGCMGAEITADGRRHVVAFRTDAAAGEPIELGGLRDAGDACAASWDETGALLARAAVELTRQGTR
jgi:hypothetical protein